MGEKLWKKIKILLAYHKEDVLLKDDVLTPIHAGREVALQSKSPEEFQWLLKNTVGDDTGENISAKNSLYNEMTTIYWAWKNMNKLENPDYIGFMHYRRHFIFSTRPKPIYEYYDEIDAKYLKSINYNKESIRKLLNDYDFICPAPQYCKSVYDQYQQNHDIADLDCAIEIIKEKYPEYSEAAEEYLNGNQAYYYNMFIFDRATFLKYCEWLFTITFELERRRDLNGKRLFASERLTGIFITNLIRNGKKPGFLPVMVAEGKHVIPLVMASDNGYALPLCVALSSIFKSAHNNTIYDVHLLLSDEYTEENLNRLKRIQKLYPRHNLNIHLMNEKCKNIGITIKHIKAPTFYRLQLPHLLANVKKCIYLDVDIIVLDDLSELYRLNIDDKYIAGIRAAGYYYPEKHAQNTMNILDIDSMEYYVNAGVLLINLQNMRRDNLEEAFNQLICKKYPSMDQDILNKVCYGKIRILHPRYNAMTKYKLLDDNSYKNNKALQIAYSIREWDSARKHPVIIHYADKIKPWEDVEMEYAYEWWRAAALLPFFSDIYRQYIKNGQMKKINVQLNEENRRIQKLFEMKCYDFDCMAASVSFKIGRLITFIPRKIRGGFRCYKEHGCLYTVKRILWHLGIK